MHLTAIKLLCLTTALQVTTSPLGGTSHLKQQWHRTCQPHNHRLKVDLSGVHGQVRSRHVSCPAGG